METSDINACLAWLLDRTIWYVAYDTCKSNLQHKRCSYEYLLVVLIQVEVVYFGLADLASDTEPSTG